MSYNIPEEIDIRCFIDQVVIMKGKRCMIWKDCQNSTESGCIRTNVPVRLSELKETCLRDEWCIAVSCEQVKIGGECARSMLFNSCDITAMKNHIKWKTYLLKQSKLK